ncbi:MAG TPA: cation transporting ATPase C-terminal domain-containing protein, partial [Xanthobacteraceae bacterium]
RVSLWRLGPLTNRPLLAAVALTALLQILLVALPFARDILDLQPLAATDWLIVLGIALGYLVAVEADKAWHHRVAARKAGAQAESAG